MEAILAPLEVAEYALGGILFLLSASYRAHARDLWRRKGRLMMIGDVGLWSTTLVIAGFFAPDVLASLYRGRARWVGW